VCAGGFRGERGQCTLPEIVSGIWEELLKPARAQIIVQRDNPQWEVPLPEEAAICAPPGVPVVYHPHPLATEEYNELIQQADVGLLLHDAHSYYSRLSAVYQEYVCAGIPVIVPAGCWLGDQIAEENFRHVEQVLRERHGQVLGSAHPEWKFGTRHDGTSLVGRFSFRGPQSPLAGEVAVPRGATELIVEWRWLARRENGQYIRLTLECRETGEQWQRAGQTVVGTRGPAGELAAMFHIPANCSKARLIFENAFAPGTIAIFEPKITWLAAPEAGAAGLPTGYAGLSFSERSEIPRLLREMIDLYPQYRECARRKLPEWCERLRPEITLSELGAVAGKPTLIQRANRAA
jgi:hypothetical protein